MPAPFSGGCLCGAVRYTCAMEPVATVQCHCRDCQRNSGSGFAIVLAVQRAAVTFQRGTPKRHTTHADSGNTVWREFCATCGCQLFAGGSVNPDFCGIKASSLDDPSWVRPLGDIWTDSAQPWDYLDPALPKAPKNLQA